MKRILIAECVQEIASFNPNQSELDSFRLSTPDQLFPEHRPLRTEIAGALGHLILEVMSSWFLLLVPGLLPLAD